MDSLIVIQTLKLTCEAGASMAEFGKALERYIDYVETSNAIREANDILKQMKDILGQEEADEALKFTRVMTHLETAYRQLLSKRRRTSFSKSRAKVQHKINQVCYALAMLHKRLGNSQDVIYKYAVELTSLGHPVATNHLSYENEGNPDDINFVMSDNDLRYLLTDEQYKKFRAAYNPVVHEIREQEEFHREYKVHFIDDDDRMV